jgi:uncharacterized protein (DUF427 family)
VTEEAERWAGLPAPAVMPSPRWIRVTAGDTVIADSRRALLLAWYGPGMLPTYCLPAPDVRTDVMRPTGDRWTFMAVHDVAVGGEVIPGVALRCEDVPPELAELEGTWTFRWDAGVSWFEEAMEVHVHARDPTKRVDVLPSERHVRVEVAGELVAESRRPHALFETALPTRWYLPADDVDWDKLVPTGTTSTCPYKGTARYWSVRAGGQEHRDLAWSYPDPIPENPRIKDLVCFFNEKVDLTVDGERQPRPVTPWSD